MSKRTLFNPLSFLNLSEKHLYLNAVQNSAAYCNAHPDDCGAIFDEANEILKDLKRPPTMTPEMKKLLYQMFTSIAESWTPEEVEGLFLDRKMVWTTKDSGPLDTLYRKREYLKNLKQS